MANFSTDAVIKRLFKLYSVRTMKELGDALGLGRGAVSNWNVRQSIPFEVLIKIQQEKGVSWDWLIDGKEEQGRKLDPLEELALVAFNALDDKGKINALSLMNGHSQPSPSNSISQNAGDNSVNNVFSGGDAINNK